MEDSIILHSHYISMENEQKFFKCKKLKLDLPKISNQTITRNSSKQNMDPFVNTSSSRFKDFKKLFFQYKSNARILEKSPYYSNNKQRKQIIETMTTHRYQLTDTISQKIQEQYGVNQQEYKNEKRLISVKMIYQNRNYCFTIKAGTIDQVNRRLKYQLAKIMVSLKNSFKKCQLIQGFETTPQNNQMNFLLSCKQVLATFNQLNVKPVFYKPSLSNKKITISDFKFIKCLGCGGFSTVYLVKGNFNGKYYALKLISKSFIIQSEREGIVENQRFILGQLRSPFVTQLEFAFQSKNHFVLVVEYCPGGQLFYQLKKVKRMSEDQAKFYFLQILVGIDYIHSKNIVYRDLKPQNLLIGLDGHIKIADFGLSKPIQNKKQTSYSFCGSPEYMAPQMLLKQGHNYLLDYYCLGALLYELVVGVPPYYSLNHEEIYQSILNQQLSFPDHVDLSQQLINLLRKLLQKNTKNRLGSMFGIKQILLHPWIGRLKQTVIENKQLIPPFIPILQNFNFDLADMKNDFQEINKKIQDDMLCKKFQTHFSDQFYFQKPQFRASLVHFKQQNRKTLQKSKSLDQNIKVKFLSKEKQFTTRKLKPNKSSKVLSMTMRK